MGSLSHKAVVLHMDYQQDFVVGMAMSFHREWVIHRGWCPLAFAYHKAMSCHKEAVWPQAGIRVVRRGLIHRDWPCRRESRTDMSQAGRGCWEESHMGSLPVDPSLENKVDLKLNILGKRYRREEMEQGSPKGSSDR